jgi:hypothetical protein
VSAVAERTSVASYASIISSDGGAGALAGFDGSANNMAMFTGGTVDIISASDNAFHAAQFIFNNASSSAYVDGTLTSSLSLGDANAWDTSGPSICNDTGSRALTGYIGEVYLLSADMTSLESTINSNQHSRYGF